ncbi:MAG TPA: caspase family protein [Bacteroidales bacterium]|nr:caspase family protein [Bacteroidales bacterium]HPT12190.1 caspase family protein [Bacteroidales bacterium]
MKTKKLLTFALVAVFAGAAFQSCTKEDPAPDNLNPVQVSASVRPDFATIDQRPADVIAMFQVTDKDATPVKPVATTAKGGKYALVIGISDYAGTANDLEYCDDDANDWKAVLQADGYTVTALIDGSATKSAIESAINTLASQSVAGNTIAFCYSGHGSKGNIISADLYYISYTWFKTKFASATSTKMMFCFDACQIGYMTNLNATGRVIAVASSKTTYSYDGDATMKNGVFTYYQMKGFTNNGYIYLEPDCSYACTQMKSWATANRVKVAPSYVDSYSGDFAL